MSVRGAPPTEAGRARRHRAYSAFGDASHAARPASRAPSLGLSQGSSPPSTSPSARGSRSLATASARCDQHRTRSVLAVSHRLDVLRHRQLAGLLQPAADPGVHRVSAHRARRVRRALLASPPVHRPPERSPPRQPRLRHRRPVPPRRSSADPAIRPPDLGALLHRGVRGVRGPWPDRHARGSPGLPVLEHVDLTKTVQRPAGSVATCGHVDREGVVHRDAVGAASPKGKEVRSTLQETAGAARRPG